MENTLNFRKHIDRKTGLYGIKLCDEKGKPQKGWWISPSYEAVEGVWQSDNSPAWFKRNGRYGALDIPNKVELIPAEYGFPPYFNREGYAIVWKDYRSGIWSIYVPRKLFKMPL